MMLGWLYGYRKPMIETTIRRDAGSPRLISVSLRHIASDPRAQVV